MKKLILYLTITAFSLPVMLSQELTGEKKSKWSQSLNFEFSQIFHLGKIKDDIAIRQNMSYANYYYNDNGASLLSYGSLIGARWEFHNRIIGLSAGIRYSRFQSIIDRYNSDEEFFYLRYPSDETSTKFASVNQISEINNFISIPVEFACYPVNIYDVRFVIRLGFDAAGYNIRKKTELEFKDPEMTAYSESIKDRIGLSSENFYSTVYVGGGLLFGKEGRTNYLFETILLGNYLSPDNFTLHQASEFFGLRLNVKVPIK